MIAIRNLTDFTAKLNQDCYEALSPYWICPAFPGEERLWLQSMLCSSIYHSAAAWLNGRGIHGFPHECESISPLESRNVIQTRLLDLCEWCNKTLKDEKASLAASPHHVDHASSRSFGCGMP